MESRDGCLPLPVTTHPPEVARAAVVMAHVVAARLQSGMPMTGDDPDLTLLLEQIHALDDGGIGRD